jgi:uncharacterized protein YoxC
LEDKRNGFPFCILPGIIGFIIAEIIVYTGGDRMSGNAIGIIVALIAVAGNLVVLYFQFKKDSNKIGEVKSDTSGMKPQVSNIDENVKKVRDEVVERIVPGMSNVEKSGDKLLTGVGKLVAELEFQKRLKSELSGTLATPEYLLEGINSIYEDNALLNRTIKEKERKLRELSRENRDLSNQLTVARKRIRELEPDREIER